MNNHWWLDYATVDKGICKPKYDNFCKEEYELTLRWVKANPDKAANFILNSIMDALENQIDVESHYLPIWYDIKGFTREHPLQTLDEDTVPVILANIEKKEDYDELVEDRNNKDDCTK